MKIKEILTESSTDLVAFYYKELAKSDDARLNKEDAEYKRKQQEYYENNFSEWYADGVIPVFTTEPCKTLQSKNIIQQNKGKVKSAGKRGVEAVMQRIRQS